MFGIHVHKGKYKTTADAIKKSNIWSINDSKKSKIIPTVQIYTHGPRGYNNVNIGNDEIIKLINDTGLQVYVHSTYYSIPWKGSEKALSHINDQYKICEEIGAKGLVLHLPKNTPEVVAKFVPNHPNVQTILEMTSVKPDDRKSYESPEKLNNLIDILENAGAKNYGICIDTSHIWAAGQNVKSKAFMDDYFKKLKYPHKIVLIHLNGSSIPLNGHKDTHIIPFTKDDKIWSGTPYNKSGVSSVVDFCKIWNVPIIMEINRGEDEEVKGIYKVLAKHFTSDSHSTRKK